MAQASHSQEQMETRASEEKLGLGTWEHGCRAGWQHWSLTISERCCQFSVRARDLVFLQGMLGHRCPFPYSASHLSSPSPSQSLTPLLHIFVIPRGESPGFADMRTGCPHTVGFPCGVLFCLGISAPSHGGELRKQCLARFDQPQPWPGALRRKHAQMRHTLAFAAVRSFHRIRRLACAWQSAFNSALWLRG